MSLMTLILAAALGWSHAAASPAAGLAPARHQAVTASIQASAASPEANDPGMTPAPGYAQRESQAKDLESFTGGRHDDVVIVTCGCVLVVVLVIVLI